MIGTYTEITIAAPRSAQEGSTVGVAVAVKNIVDYTIYVAPVLDVNGSITEGSYETLIPGETKYWQFSFIMPSDSVLLTASSWCEDTFVWQKDCSAEQTVYIPSAISLVLGNVVTLMIVMMMMSMMMKTMKGI